MGYPGRGGDYAERGYPVNRMRLARSTGESAGNSHPKPEKATEKEKAVGVTDMKKWTAIFLLLSLHVFCMPVFANDFPEINESTREGKLLLQFLEQEKRSAQRKGRTLEDLGEQYTMCSAYAAVCAECMKEKDQEVFNQLSFLHETFFALDARLLDQQTAARDFQQEYSRIKRYINDDCDKLKDMIIHVQLFSTKMRDMEILFSTAKNDAEENAPSPFVLLELISLIVALCGLIHTIINRKKRALVTGVSGWLQFFIGMSAMATIADVTLEILEVLDLQKEYPHTTFVANLYAAIIILYNAVVFYSLYMLIYVKKHAVLVTRILLVLRPVVYCMSPMLLWLLSSIFIPEFRITSQMVDVTYNELFYEHFIAFSLVSLLWFVYFCVSRRVKNTWDAKFRPVYRQSPFNAKTPLGPAGPVSAGKPENRL